MSLDILPNEDSLNKFNKFKINKNIQTIMFNIRLTEGKEHVVFVKELYESSLIEKNISDSLPNDEAIFIYRKIIVKNKEEKIICIMYYPKYARACKIFLCCNI